MATKTLDQHIVVSPGIAGGKPRIRRRRITVQNIVVRHELLGRSADEIATEYDLTLADVYAALVYYHDHRHEIDKAIRDSKKFVDTLRRRIPSKIALTLDEQD